MVDVLDAAADLLEEQRLLAGMDRSYRERGAGIREEAASWDGTLADGFADES